MKRILNLILLLVFLVSCAGSKNEESIAEQLSSELKIEPVDYSNPALWGCSSEKSDDVCDMDYSMIRVESDGTEFPEPYTPAEDTGIDCFYIYPTMDLDFNPGNHEDLSDVELFLEVIKIQAGRFSEVCRVFAPFYRQATIGTYMAETSVAAGIFKKAFFDVATAFEYYLKHWNNGRKIIIMGHSQGAQMASYLLHKYFDGAVHVTNINGSQTSEELRSRLLVGFPIGFNVFVKDGETRGGSFSDIPLCSSPEETGCVIHYRSYAEGTKFNNSPAGFGATIDNFLAQEGFLNREFNSDTDVISCVNPSIKTLPDDHTSIDRDGNNVEPGDIRILEGTYLYGLLSAVYSGSGEATEPKHLPERYTATCRRSGASNFLAIGLHEIPGVTDVRGDPIKISSSDNLLGLHLYDYSLALGDLINQVKIKASTVNNGINKKTMLTYFCVPVAQLDRALDSGKNNLCGWIEINSF